MAMAKRTGSASATHELRELLLWARKERIVLGAVSIGEVSVSVVDLGMEAPTKGKVKRTKEDMFAHFAGPHADQLKDAGLADDDDEAPAVQ